MTHTSDRSYSYAGAIGYIYVMTTFRARLVPVNPLLNPAQSAGEEGSVGVGGWTPQDRSALVVANRGLGNFVILAPILEELERSWPELRYHLPDNALAERDRFMKYVKLRAVTEPSIPPLWRRFLPEHQEDMLSFMEEHAVSLVLNARKEDLAHDGNYLQFRETATRAGIECWDLHELGPEHQRLSIGEQIIAMFRAHGIELGAARTNWLQPARRHIRHGVVGLFVGASTGVRRWPAKKWAVTARTLVQSHDVMVEVVAGLGPAEVTLGAEVVAEAGTEGVIAHRAESVEELVSWIGSLSLLASNDTVAVHLAAALGCPVIALYLATDGAIWSPRSLPGRLTTVQSHTALRCRAMKPDGTCSRFYLGCPAPCRRAVTSSMVVEAIAAAIDAEHGRVGG
jgi:hypothetical protein